MDFSITQLAKQYSLNVETLRYYERIGLIPEVPRRANGNRFYDEKLQKWIEMIVCLRHSGVEVKSLIEYVDLIKKGDETLESRKELLQEQERQLSEKKKNLDISINRLKHKINLYETGEIKNNKSYYEEYEIEKDILNKKACDLNP